MAHRVAGRPRGLAALTALALILVITASWWALALWPMSSDTPAWVARTRLVCFGAAPDGLPNAGGWVILIGQPLGMLIVLFAAWGRNVRAGFSTLMQRVPGQLTVGLATAGFVAGLVGVVVRVRDADAQPFSLDRRADAVAALTRINDTPAALDLIDQHGEHVTLDRFKGRPVLVTFAYAHCETVCPMIVHDVMFAAEKVAAQAPVVLIVTLDPWRDTPSRLPAVAAQWGATRDAHILSGAPDDVDRVLNAWRIPRVRNERTGDLSHPSVVYVINREGKITYALPGGAEQIIAAVQAE